jgi:hypothetical protein
MAGDAALVPLSCLPDGGPIAGQKNRRLPKNPGYYTSITVLEVVSTGLRFLVSLSGPKVPPKAGMFFRMSETCTCGEQRLSGPKSLQNPKLPWLAKPRRARQIIKNATKGMRARSSGRTAVQARIRSADGLTPLFPAGLLAVWFVLTCAAITAGQDVLTYHNDNGRTGLDPNEKTLTWTNVNSSTFGKVFVLSVDGKVDAEPLYVSNVSVPGKGTRNMLIVVTEHDSIYAFDADTGASLWPQDPVTALLTGESPSDDRGCSQVTPEIGITSTPVVDRGSGPHGTIYLVAMSKDGSGAYHQRLHALDLTTGGEEFGGPVEIQATYPGKGANSDGTSVIFDPKQYKERSGLLRLNGLIYTSWSSHCDGGAYTGWIMSYNEANLAQVSVLNITPNGNDGAIWQSGSGPAVDSSGYIYFLAANGTFDTTLTAQGFPSKGDYGNAFMKLSTTQNVLAVADYFTMSNTVAESNADKDLGSGGAVVLPDMKDSQGNTRHLAVGAGKDTILYLVDRDNMGKFNSGGDQIYQEFLAALPGGVWSTPAYFNGYLYYGAQRDYLRAFRFTNARLETPAKSKSAITFAYPGATPSVSANGVGNGIVWATENTDPAVLHAYKATDLTQELYNSTQAGTRDQFGTGNKFITPMIANGRVYVGTTGSVGVFGLLTPYTTVAPSSLSFGTEAIATGSAPKSIIVANGGNATLNFSAISTQGDFSETNTCGSSLAVGARCTVNVSFAPLAAGPRKGTLSISDNAAGSPHAVVLTGVGTAAKLSPPNLSFSSQIVGTSSPGQAITLTNRGSQVMNIWQFAITGTNAADFSQTHTCGSSLAQGSSCTISVTFAPSAPGARSATLLLSDDGGGSPQSAALTGTGVAGSKPARSVHASAASSVRQ